MTIAGRNFPVPILIAIAVIADRRPRRVVALRHAPRRQGGGRGGRRATEGRRPVRGWIPCSAATRADAQGAGATTRRRRRTAPAARQMPTRIRRRRVVADDTTGRDLSEPQGEQPRSEGGPSVPEGGSQPPAKRVPPRAPAKPSAADRRTEDEPGFVQSLFAPVAGFGVTFGTMFRKVAHRGVPRGEAPHRGAVPRAPPAEPARGRPREVRRLRALRVGLPGRRDLRRGRRQRRQRGRRRPVLARRALRPRLPDQLPALHLLRPLHRGLPDPGPDDDQLLRAGRQQPRRPHLHQGAAARADPGGHAPGAAPDGRRAWRRRDYYQGKVTRATRRAGGVGPLAPAPERGRSPAPPGDVSDDAVGLGNTGTRGPSPTEDAGGAVQTGAVSAPTAWIGESR